MIKRVSERLEIYVRRVHVPVKICASIVGNVAGCYRHRFDSAIATSISDVDRVFGENDRIIISERDRSTAESLGRERDLLRRRQIGELVPFARLGDVPVLAKAAAKITTRCSKREHAGARQ